MEEEQNSASTSVDTEVPIEEQAKASETVTVVKEPFIMSQAQLPKRKRVNMKLLLVISMAVLLLTAAAVYWFVLKKDPNSTVKQNEKQSAQESQPDPITYVPSYDLTHSTAEFDGATWYAVTGGVIRIADKKAQYFTSSQGVPNGAPQSLVAYNNQLWLATQNGVAVYDTSAKKFNEVKVDGLNNTLRNGDLYYDASAKKLYLNDFEGFYLYNEQSKKWEKQVGPQNVRSFAANDKYIAVYAAQSPWSVWVYTKSTGKWVQNSPEIEDQTADLFIIDGNIFVSGRSTGYTSCEMAGKVVATSVYTLNATGLWQAMTAFNSDKTRPELRFIRSVAQKPRFKSQACSDDQKSKTYDASYTGGVFSLVNEKEATSDQNSSLQDTTEQKAFIDTINSVTKLHASMQILDVDGKGNVVYGYSDEISGSVSSNKQSIAVAKGNSLSQATTLDMTLAKNNINYTVMCGSGENSKLSYILNAEQSIPVVKYEGFPDGTWSSAKLYKVDGSTLSLAADLGGDISYPSFVCTDTTLTYLGKTGLRKLDRATGKSEAIGSKLAESILYSQSAFVAAPNGNAWFSITTTNSSGQSSSKLYFYDATKASATQIAAFAGTSSLAAATNAYSVVFINQEKSTKHVVYDSAGKAVQTIDGAAGASAMPTLGVNGKDNEFYAMTFAASNQYSIFVPFTLNKLTVGSALAKVNVTNQAFTSSYLYGGDAFGLPSKSYVTADTTRNAIWLSDTMFGISMLSL